MRFRSAPGNVIDRGWGTLALSDKKSTRRSAKEPADNGGEGNGDRDVGHALRSVYSKAVSEDIPPELLDLLGKLS